MARNAIMRIGAVKTRKMLPAKNLKKKQLALNSHHIQSEKKKTKAKKTKIKERKFPTKEWEKVKKKEAHGQKKPEEICREVFGPDKF